MLAPQNITVAYPHLLPSQDTPSLLPTFVFLPLPVFLLSPPLFFLPLSVSVALLVPMP